MFSPLKLAVKKVVILPWVGEKEGSFKSARGGVGQGGHHGDRPRGHSMLLLHLPVVPKIEKADVSLSGSGFFFFFFLCTALLDPRSCPHSCVFTRCRSYFGQRLFDPFLTLT